MFLIFYFFYSRLGHLSYVGQCYKMGDTKR